MIKGLLKKFFIQFNFIDIIYVELRSSNIRTFLGIRNLSEMLNINNFQKVLLGDKRIVEFICTGPMAINQFFTFKPHAYFLQNLPGAPVFRHCAAYDAPYIQIPES